MVIEKLASRLAIAAHHVPVLLLLGGTFSFMKTCNTCGKEFTSEFFHRNRRTRDGIAHRCKVCANIYKRFHAKSDRARAARARYKISARALFNKWSKEYRERHPESVKQTLRKYNSNNKLKRSARTSVSNAIRDGKITRGHCSVCGCAKAEAHHDNYSQPLNIRWLCKRHHEELHLHLAKMGCEEL